MGVVLFTKNAYGLYMETNMEVAYVCIWGMFPTFHSDSIDLDHTKLPSKKIVWERGIHFFRILEVGRCISGGSSSLRLVVWSVAVMNCYNTHEREVMSICPFPSLRILLMEEIQFDMGVSKNRGTPKWMVYDGKPY